MTFQDEFIHRLRVVRGEATGDGGEDAPDKSVRPEPVESQATAGERLCSDDRGPSTSSGRTDGDGVKSSLCSAPDAEPCGPGTGGSADAQSSASSAEHNPTGRHDGWHRELRVKFLEALAQTGNVGASAYFVQRTRQSAYALKRRDPDFARAWLAALVLAREEAQDKLQERAIEGVEEEIFYHGEVVATRRRYDSRLLLALLARLDKVAEQIPAQRGAARFGDMLNAIGAGEDTAPLIATPTEEELAIRAAESEARGGPVQEDDEEEEGAEFYALTWPDNDGPPDYYRMTPEDAAEMERQVPGLVAKATGTTDDALICALVDRAEMAADIAAVGALAAGKGNESMTV
ncbi:hypothetical protein [Parasphingorhabdus sp.]|uniref:hypothetical protein n=1 Tax=Parasphingorhabdus sp. TaxID=2709688 RepID=UPI003267991D